MYIFRAIFLAVFKMRIDNLIFFFLLNKVLVRIDDHCFFLLGGGPIMFTYSRSLGLGYS